MKKVKVVAKVANSPVMPVKSFVAEHILTFDDNENVFGRVLKFRKEFKERYGQGIILDILKIEWLPV